MRQSMRYARSDEYVGDVERRRVRECVALSASAERARVHAIRYGSGKDAAPVVVAPAPELRQRRSTGELVVDARTFADLDFGQLCQRLGLRPSQPHVRADGSRHRSKGKRRKRARA